MFLNYKRDIFPFQYFNAIQSVVFDSAFNTDESLVVAAPTVTNN